MVKYGKEFRKNQINDWKEKYFGYKAQKQLIKKYVKEKSEITPENIRIQLEKWSLQFGEGLDADIKKVYIKDLETIFLPIHSNKNRFYVCRL